MLRHARLWEELANVVILTGVLSGRQFDSANQLAC